MVEQEIIKRLAKELAQRDYESLCGLVSTMSFETAYKTLNGFNRMDLSNTSVGEDFFDCNYKSICVTIYYEKKFGGCVVDNKVDVWLNDISSPIDTITIKQQ